MLLKETLEGAKTKTGDNLSITSRQGYGTTWSQYEFENYSESAAGATSTSAGAETAMTMPVASK